MLALCRLKFFSRQAHISPQPSRCHIEVTIQVKYPLSMNTLLIKALTSMMRQVQLGHWAVSGKHLQEPGHRARTADCMASAKHNRICLNGCWEVSLSDSTAGWNCEGKGCNAAEMAARRLLIFSRTPKATKTSASWGFASSAAAASFLPISAQMQKKARSLSSPLKQFRDLAAYSAEGSAAAFQ